MNSLNGPNHSKNNSPPVGAVMVVGGGIGGIQASLDLANSGFRVYLVEEEPAIGGRMLTPNCTNFRASREILRL